MYIDSSLEGITSFAQIGQLSCANKNKNQILFSMLSLFLFENIKEANNGVWYINLKLSSTPNDLLIEQMRKTKSRTQ